MGWRSGAVFCVAIVCGLAMAEDVMPWKNRVGISSGSRVRYQRELGWGFWVGPSSSYSLEWVFTESGLLHLDQEPGYTFFNLSHEARWKAFGLENTLHGLDSELHWRDYVVTSKAKLWMGTGGRLLVVPGVQWLRFEHYPVKDRYSGVVSEYRLGAEMAVDVEMEIRF